MYAHSTMHSTEAATVPDWRTRDSRRASLPTRRPFRPREICASNWERPSAIPGRRSLTPALGHGFPQPKLRLCRQSHPATALVAGRGGAGCEIFKEVWIFAATEESPFLKLVAVKTVLPHLAVRSDLRRRAGSIPSGKMRWSWSEPRRSRSRAVPRRDASEVERIDDV